jgi:AbrB family looped-hinge helix DNA binding protein
MPSTTVTSKGRVTIPKRIRQFLRIRPGDRIGSDIDANGTVVVWRAGTHVQMLKGILSRPGRRPVSLETIEAVVARHLRWRR